MKRWTLVVITLVLLNGCYAAGLEMNRLYGLDCRPEVVKQTGGTCAAVPPGRLGGK